MRRFGALLSLVLFTCAGLVLGAPSAQAKPKPVLADGWRVSVTNADQNLRGVVAVSRTEAWVTGQSLTSGPARIFHTTDGGQSWQDVTPPGTEGLSFRDVEVSASGVHVLAIGPGDASRIYRSTTGGRTWTETFRNTDANAFYDCMAFYPGGRNGLVVSDPVDGKLRILATSDGGATWSVLPNAGMPESSTEGAFAASGECLTITGGTAYIITGGGKARVLRSDDRGYTWTATETGMPTNDNGAAGGFAGTFGNKNIGIVVGGDFAAPTVTTNNVAVTRNGRTWTTVASLTHVGEDVAFVGGGHKVAIAVGTYRGSDGTSVTTDGGQSWTRVSAQGFHAIDCLPDGTCWAAGANGQVGWTR